jgi:hypothetical protein
MIDILLCPECQSSKLMSEYTVELPYNETKSGVVCDLKGVTPTSYTDSAYDTTGEYKNISDRLECKCGWSGSTDDAEVE